MIQTLSAAIGTYPHTAALKDGRVPSPLLRLEFADITPINRAFAPMVRTLCFDVAELAIATFLQARACDKALVLLPIVLAARLQEPALLCRADSDLTPGALAGKRIGVRAYSQTTAMWLRGILLDSFGVRPEQMRWTTFEGAHVAEIPEPAFAERAPPGTDLLGMLRDGTLDAAIVGQDLPADPAFRALIPDPVQAGVRFRERYGMVPPNHLVVVKRTLARDRPDLMSELVRLFAAADTPGSPPQGMAAVAPGVALALRFASEQAMLSRPLTPEEVWDGFSGPAS